MESESMKEFKDKIQDHKEEIFRFLASLGIKDALIIAQPGIVKCEDHISAGLALVAGAPENIVKALGCALYMSPHINNLVKLGLEYKDLLSALSGCCIQSSIEKTVVDS